MAPKQKYLTLKVACFGANKVYSMSKLVLFSFFLCSYRKYFLPMKIAKGIPSKLGYLKNILKGLFLSDSVDLLLLESQLLFLSLKIILVSPFIFKSSKNNL